jgi:perosamine synthetase
LHLYTVLVDEDRTGITRDAFLDGMARHNIGVGVHYPPNHLQPAFAEWTTSLPVTETIGRRLLSLPFHPSLSTADVDQVVTALTDALTS